MDINFAKLRNGDWGVRIKEIEGDPRQYEGKVVTVTTKKGEQKDVLVDRLVKEFPDASLFSICDN